MSMQIIYVLKLIYKYTLRTLLCITVAYFVILTKMPWIYYCKSICANDKRLLLKDEIEAYSCFIRNRDSAKIRFLIDSGRLFGAIVNESGNTLLHDAAVNNSLECCKCLIEYGNVNPNVKNKNGLTSLDLIYFCTPTYEYIARRGGLHSWKYYFWLQKWR